MKKYISIVIKIIKDGFIYIFTGNMLGQIFGFVAGLLIVRLVTKNEYAYYSYANNILSYLSLICFCGLPSAILNYCGGKNGKTTDRGYVFWAIKTGGIFQIIIGIGVCLVFYFIDIPFPESKKYVYMLAFIPALSGMKSVYQAYLQSRMEYGKYASLSIIYFVVYLCFVILLAKPFGVYGVISSIYIAFSITAFVGWKWSNKILDDRNYGAELNSEQKKTFLLMGIAILFSSFFSAIIPINETFLVNNLIKNSDIVAEYKVATLIPYQLMVVASSLVAYFYPQVANMRKDRKLQSYLKKVGIGTGVTIFSLVLIGILITEPLVAVLYGERYLGAIQISYILWLVYGINSGIRTVPNNMLLALRDKRFCVCLSVITCTLHFCLDYYFITSLGMLGVAYASIISYGISGIVLWARLLYITKEKGCE